MNIPRENRPGVSGVLKTICLQSSEDRLRAEPNLTDVSHKRVLTK